MLRLRPLRLQEVQWVAAGCGGCWRVPRGDGCFAGDGGILPATAPHKLLHARPCVGARELPGTRLGRGGLPNTFGPVLFTAGIFNEP